MKSRIIFISWYYLLETVYFTSSYDIVCFLIDFEERIQGRTSKWIYPFNPQTYPQKVWISHSTFISLMVYTILESFAGSHFHHQGLIMLS
jgi:hypothetical protein